MSYIQHRVFNYLQHVSRSQFPRLQQPLTYLYWTWCRRNHLTRQYSSIICSESDKNNSQKNKRHGSNLVLTCRQRMLDKRHKCSVHATRNMSSRPSSSIFISDQESNFSNFEFDPRLNESRVDELIRNGQRRGVDIDVDQLVGELFPYISFYIDNHCLKSHQSTFSVKNVEFINYINCIHKGMTFDPQVFKMFQGFFPPIT